MRQYLPVNFEARFVGYERDASTEIFISWKIGALDSSKQNSTLKKTPTITTFPDGLGCLPVAINNHLWSAVAADNGVSFLITPLDDIGRDDGRGTLRFNIPYVEFGVDGG